MPPHIEIESHNHHHDDWRRSQQSSGGGGGRSNSSSSSSSSSIIIEYSSPLFRDHHDDRTFLAGASSSSCRLDRRVCNPNYNEGKESLELDGDAPVGSQQQQQPATKQPQEAALPVSRIAAIIGPESAYYAKACPNNEEGFVRRLSAPSTSSSVTSTMPTPLPARTSSSASVVGAEPATPPSSPSSTSTSLSSTPSSSSTCCNEKGRMEKSNKSVFSRLRKYIGSSSRVKNKATQNRKVSPPPTQQLERNII
ncbi:hypothetical protein ACHAWU_002708 [Discostella pseudostelligera]|uniref:Uncharacterized protein n=1 Tax=Discostella pseudostelligera TaxID=259834 RepID=A0ABD3MQ02_9STRA